MKVKLKPETIAWLEAQVSGGEFTSISEAIDGLVEQEVEMDAMLADIDPSLSPEELTARLVDMAQGSEFDDDEADEGDIPDIAKKQPATGKSRT